MFLAYAQLPVWGGEAGNPNGVLVSQEGGYGRTGPKESESAFGTGLAGFDSLGVRDEGVRGPEPQTVPATEANRLRSPMRLTFMRFPVD
jgi:hypothetical protein